jgi:hypothetical protein
MAKSDRQWVKPDATPICEKSAAWTKRMIETDCEIANYLSTYSTPRMLCPDSGATSTMCPHRDMFIDYRDTRTANQCVRLGDESQHILIHGRGTMIMEVAGKVIAYDKVLHVPDLSAILLSSRVHRRAAKGCAFIADNSGCFLTYPDFHVEIDDTEDCTIECHPVSSTTIVPDFDGRCHVTQHSSKAAVARSFELGFRAMQTARINAVIKTQKIPEVQHPPTQQYPTVPVYSVPDSGGPNVKRIHSSDLRRYFGCRKLANWTQLEDTGTGIHVVDNRDAPPLLVISPPSNVIVTATCSSVHLTHSILSVWISATVTALAQEGTNLPLPWSTTAHVTFGSMVSKQSRLKTSSRHFGISLLTPVVSLDAFNATLMLAS